MRDVICPSCGHENIPGSDECAECMTSLTKEDVPPDVARNTVERALMEERVVDLRPANPVALPRTATLAEAISTLRTTKIGCVLVSEDSGALCGIFTERDLLNRVVLETADHDLTRIDAVMTPAPETIEPDRPLGYALQRMMVGDLRHLPLTDENGKAVGIISSRDVIRHLCDLVYARA